MGEPHPAVGGPMLAHGTPHSHHPWRIPRERLERIFAEREAAVRA
jgi:hypothetical protein